MATIGVFDSGVGGQSVVNAIAKELPQHKVIYREDHKNIPYGSKTKTELLALVTPIISEMAQPCDVIVIACNTVSTVLSQDLRDLFSVPFVALDPMIKPAAMQTRTKVVAVCATTATLKSTRYNQLKKKYAQHVTVLEPDCDSWATMIEEDNIDEQTVIALVKDLLKQGADVIVLACTHYHWIEELIRQNVDAGVSVLQPEQAIILQLKRVLAQLL